MTAVLNRPTAPDRTEVDLAAWAIGAPRLLAGLDQHERLDLRTHLAVHGPVHGSDFARILAYLDQAGIAGRGGAGFPLADKLRSLAPDTRREVVVNGTESEPASRKDRVLLHRSPHLVLDGALAVAQAIGARVVTVAVHSERTARAVRAAVKERPDARRVRVRTVPGGFVAGEARAVIRSVHGGPALPTGRKTPPTHDGILLGNVESMAQLAVLLRIGPRRFADTGSRAEPGTTLLTVGGAVGRPGVVEIPLGTPLGIVLAAAQAAPDPQAVIVGGYHGAWIAPVSQTRLSHNGLKSVGGTLGAGVLLVVDRATCALGELAHVAEWLAAESAKQCGPCRFGLPALAGDVAALAAGRHAGLAAAVGHAKTVAGRGACAHPDGAARFVTSGLHLLQDETNRHARHGTCGRPVLGRLPVGGTS